MPLPQRSVALNPTQNRENPVRVAKVNTGLPTLRTAQRSALGDIPPPNRTIQNQSSLILRKPAVSHLPKRTSTVGAATRNTSLISKPTVKTAVAKNLPDVTSGKNVSYSTNQIETILDVDADDTKNPFLVTEYVQDIFQYLRHLESLHKIQEKHLIGHQTTARMRSVLINWIVDVCINFKFLQETLHLSVNILDRYLQINKTIGRDILQLVGIASMLIASKYEEIYVPAISDFVYICDNAFTAKQIFKTENDILNKLKFNLGKPLSLHFLRRFSKIASCNLDQHNLAKYFLEIFLLDYDICSVDPSLQGAVACCLSMCVLDDKPTPASAWSKTLEHYSTYKYADLKPVIIKFVIALRRMEKSKFQAIKKKYADNKLGNVSNHLKLQTSQALKDIYEKASALAKH